MTEWTETQVTTKVSPRSVTATVSRLTGIMSAKGMKVFAVIDQRAEARQLAREPASPTAEHFEQNQNGSE